MDIYKMSEKVENALSKEKDVIFLRLSEEELPSDLKQKVNFVLSQGSLDMYDIACFICDPHYLEDYISRSSLPGSRAAHLLLLTNSLKIFLRTSLG